MQNYCSYHGYIFTVQQSTMLVNETKDRKQEKTTEMLMESKGRGKIFKFPKTAAVKLLFFQILLF